MGVAHLGEEGPLLEEDANAEHDIHGAQFVALEGAWGEEDHFKAGGQDVRKEWRVKDRQLGRELAEQRIPVATQSHEGVHAWLNTLGRRQHDAPVMRSPVPGRNRHRSPCAIATVQGR